MIIFPARRLSRPGLLIVAISIGIASVGAFEAADAAPAIENGDFESPEISNPDSSDPVDGHGWTSNYGIYIGRSDGLTRNPPAPTPNGGQFAFNLNGQPAKASQQVNDFVVGQAYQVEWLNSYLLGVATPVQVGVYDLVLDEGLPTEKVIYPLSKSSFADWSRLSSDPFVAEKASYSVSWRAGFATTAVDDIQIRPALTANDPRTVQRVTLTLQPDSFLSAEAVIGGVGLGAVVDLPLTGSLVLDLDVAPARGITGFRVVEEHLVHDDTQGTLDLGVLGSVDFDLHDAQWASGFDLVSDAPNAARTSVTSDGRFQVNGDPGFYQTGVVDYLSHGAIQAFLPSGSLPALDLTFFARNDVLLPGNISKTTGPAPGTEIITFDLPLEMITSFTLVPFDFHYTGRILATATVHSVPEPTAWQLAALGIFGWWLVRPRRRAC